MFMCVSMSAYILQTFGYPTLCVMNSVWGHRKPCEYLSQHSLKRDSKVNDMIAYVVTSAFYSDLIFEK